MNPIQMEIDLFTIFIKLIEKEKEAVVRKGIRIRIKRALTEHWPIEINL